MALALYGQASYGEVLRCLLEGIRWLKLGGTGLVLATKSSYRHGYADGHCALSRWPAPNLSGDADPHGLVSAPDAERHPEIVRRVREVLPNRSLRPVAYRVEAEGELWRVVEATG